MLFCRFSVITTLLVLTLVSLLFHGVDSKKVKCKKGFNPVSLKKNPKLLDIRVTAVTPIKNPKDLYKGGTKKITFRHQAFIGIDSNSKSLKLTALCLKVKGAFELEFTYFSGKPKEEVGRNTKKIGAKKMKKFSKVCAGDIPDIPIYGVFVNIKSNRAMDGQGPQEISAGGLTVDGCRKKK